MSRQAHQTVGETIDGILDLPDELSSGKDFLVLSLDDIGKWDKIFTKKRMEIVRELKKKNPKSETQLANALKRKRENVIYDLKILEHFNIIKRKKEGRRTVIQLNRSLAVIPFA